MDFPGTEEVRIRLRSVPLSAAVRANSLFPKFVVLDGVADHYKACHNPTELNEFSDDVVVYEPIDYYPYVFNKYFFDKDEKTRVFYFFPGDENVTWGSYLIHFGDPVTFG